MHHSSRTDWVKDHTRNRVLMAMGWRLLPVTWEDLTVTAPLFVALVATAIGVQLP